MYNIEDMTSIFHKIYSGEVTSYSIYRGDEEDKVLGATIVLDSNQHNLGQLVAFLGDQTVHDIKRTVQLPPLAKVVLNETVDFACELITARGVAPQAFLTRTEGQVLQAHLVARPVNYDSDGTNKDECLQTLFTGKRAASSEEMGNIRDKLSLTKEQKTILTQHLAQIAAGEKPSTSIIGIAQMPKVSTIIL